MKFSRRVIISRIKAIISMMRSGLVTVPSWNLADHSAATFLSPGITPSSGFAVGVSMNIMKPVSERSLPSSASCL